MKECCRDSWTANDVSGLPSYFKQNVFGQHLVLDILPNVISKHKKEKDPQKPLVLSFHGSTGTGKNHVSGIIAKHLYPKGFDSKYVTKILSSHEFPSNDRLEEYQEKLKRMIRNGISKCDHALFIIDEVDKMPPGLIDTLKPYLDYNDKVDGKDFRKAIFIFMGNTGVDEINEVALDFLKQGKTRETITMKAMNKLLKTISYHSGGLHKSQLIEKHLIDFHVPFLPLERTHVRMCATVEFEKRGIHVTREKLKKIADELEYFPPPPECTPQEKNCMLDVYSVSGCKNVERLVQAFF